MGVYVWTLDFCYFNVLSWNLKKSVIIWKLLIFLLGFSFLVFQIRQTYISLPTTHNPIQREYRLHFPTSLLQYFIFHFLWVYYSKEGSTSISRLLTPLRNSLRLPRPSPKNNFFSFYWMWNARHGSYRHHAGTLRGRRLVSASAMSGRVWTLGERQTHKLLFSTW